MGSVFLWEILSFHHNQVCLKHILSKLLINNPRDSIIFVATQ